MKNVFVSALMVSTLLAASSASAANTTGFKRVAYSWTTSTGDTDYSWDTQLTTVTGTETCPDSADCQRYYFDRTIVVPYSSSVSNFKLLRITAWLKKTPSAEGYSSHDWDFKNEDGTWGSETTEYDPYPEGSYLVYKADRRYNNTVGGYWAGNREVRFDAYYPGSGVEVVRGFDLMFVFFITG